MNIFIAGGAGYIGSAAAAELIRRGHQVTVYDSLVTGYREAVPAKAHFYPGDLADSARLDLALSHRPHDAVMHFAAFIEAGVSMKEPGRFFHNNFSNSVQLLDAAVKAGVRKIVFSSTAAVYRSSDEPISEVSPLDPVNVYGQTKWMVEQALAWYMRIFGLRFAALRYFNAAGAADGRGEAHQPESHLIPLVLKTALGQRESIGVFGRDYPTPDGTAIRDYIHISDLVSAHVLALDALDTHDQLTYNLGNGKGYSVQEVIDCAKKVTGKVIPIRDLPRRPGDAARLVASSVRIQNDLGWKPAHPSLEEIISSAWDWHSRHPDGYLK